MFADQLCANVEENLGKIHVLSEKSYQHWNPVVLNPVDQRSMPGADGLVVFEAAEHRDALGYGVQSSFLIKEEQQLTCKTAFSGQHSE